MMSPIGTNLFKVGERYFDAVGRKWTVRQIFNVNGWPCLMLSLSKWTLVTFYHRLTNEWHPAIVEDGGKTATILLNGGFFSTLYAEEEEE